MTEVLQLSAESNQTADIFDIAQKKTAQKIESRYSYADMDIYIELR